MNSAAPSATSATGTHLTSTISSDETAVQDTAAEERRRAQQERLAESITQYQAKKFDYGHAEKIAIALYARPADTYASVSNKNKASVILGNFRKKFEGLKEAYENFITIHRICEELGVTDESMGDSITTRRNEFEYYFNEAQQSFNRNSVKLIQHTKCYNKNIEALEKEKTEYKNKKNDIEATIKKYNHSINSANVIHITKIEDAITDIRNKLSAMAHSHKHLTAICTPDVALGDKDLEILEKDHRRLLSISSQYLIELGNMIFFAKTDNTPDYIWSTATKKAFILESDSVSNRVRAKISGVGIYEGEWQNDLPEGLGIFKYRNGGSYKGTLRAGLPHGFGVLHYANGAEYEGQLERGVPHGTGVMHYANGSSYAGEWVSGVTHGRGVQVWSNGIRFAGSWVAGVAQGAGVYHNVDGIKIDCIMNNDYCDSIQEDKKNLDCYHQLILGATGQTFKGYVEVAMLRAAKKIEYTSLDTNNKHEEYIEYRNNMLGLVEQSHKWSLLKGHDRLPVWNDNLKFGGNGILFEPNVDGHAVKVEIIPPQSEGGRYVVSIFNSGAGLFFHRRLDKTKKYETRLSIYFDTNKIGYLKKIFIEYSKFYVEGFYQFVLNNRSLAPPHVSDAQPNYRITHQAMQKDAENCATECWMAVFKNKAFQMHEKSGLAHYNQFRNELMKHALDAELEKLGTPTLSRGQHKRNMATVSTAQQITRERLEKIKLKAENLLPDKSIEDVFRESAERLYPSEPQKQNALICCVKPEKLKANLDAINSDKEWSLNAVLLASAFSKIVKRELEILEVISP
ncbi:MORN repeat-containing protein [Pandoraea sputorum]|uniref:MORN repeat-containing protein n=1 Tax=Pandoraea sputorum TaxID=93222 RepID=UPI0012414668|nr:hypothetical protein [Pandoraea sputorum]VVE55215.1 MORN repeat-containing protein [Pandoraea sputorum]